MNLMVQINRIERLDQLIRMKSTGRPEQLADRMEISRSTLYNIIDFMKGQGADIYYCSKRQSFCYNQQVYFYFGFSVDKVQLKRVSGGGQIFFSNYCGNPVFLDGVGIPLYQSVLLKGESRTLPAGT